MRALTAFQAVAVFLLAGCLFDTSATTATGADGDTTGAADASVDPAGADATVDPEIDAAPPVPRLVDDDLIVRYYVDEAEGGRGPLQFLDAANAPLHLSIEYRMPPVASYTEVAGNRGLRFATIPDENDIARASVQTDGTKIETALQGSTTATIELVADLDDVADNDGILSYLGAGTDSGVFAIRGPDTDSLEIRVNNARAARYDVDYTQIDRVVLHLVLDSNAADPADRIKLYLDGTLIASSDSDGPSQGETLDLSAANTFYALGNRPAGDRGVSGIFFYAAMYAKALSAEDIANNRAILDLDDDTPAAP